MDDDTELSTEREGQGRQAHTTIDEYAEELEAMSSPDDDVPASKRKRQLRNQLYG